MTAMKSIIFIAAAVCILQSCQFGESAESATADSTVIYRDTTITAANAYSDLFLDSNAVTKYIQSEKVDTAIATMMRNFYIVRNDQFAWFSSQGLTEEGRSFWSMYGSDSTGSKAGQANPNDRLAAHMDSLVQKDSLSISNTDSNYVYAELALTRKLAELAGTGKGPVTKQNFYTIVPRKKMEPLALADSILHKQKDSAALASNAAYAAMKQQLEVYFNAAKKGGWQPLTTAAGLERGAASPAVTLLKKRLQATNDYAASDTNTVFNDSFVAAIKDVQQRHGLAPTGSVNDSLITALNVPAEERVQQILLNMNRLAWMPKPETGNRIEVNIPAQMLYAYEGDTKVFEMPVIVGKEGSATVAFSGQINEVVFNPSWHLPESIVKNEIMPEMKKDPDYLKKNNMEIVSQQDSVPVLKQLPGKDNPLGDVKFLFPNSHEIYLHDTPDKSLFKRTDRALSHGCIRVADAQKLAEYLLRDKKDWTPEKIRAAMNGNKEQSVAVSKKQPVQISYLSAWVDSAGKMNFRNDINGWDQQTMARMFTNAGSSDIAKTQWDSTRLKTDTAKTKTDVAGKRK